MSDGDPIFFILKGPSYPPAEEATTMLGRVVKNFAQPIADYVPKDASKFRDEKPNVTELSNATRTAVFAKMREWEGRFMNLAEASAETGLASYSNIENSTLRVWELRGQEDCFLRLMEDPLVSAKVKTWARPRKDPTFMVVGLLVWESAKVTHVEMDSKQKGAQGAVPTGTAVAAALAANTGLAMSPEAIGDVKMGYGSGHASTLKRSNESKEGRVFGVQCRNIRTRYRNFFKTDTTLDADGPRVDADRMYGTDTAESAGGDIGIRDDIEALLEPSDVLWTDALEDTDDTMNLEVHRVGDEQQLALAFAET